MTTDGYPKFRAAFSVAEFFPIATTGDMPAVHRPAREQLRITCFDRQAVTEPTHTL